MRGHGCVPFKKKNLTKRDIANKKRKKGRNNN